MRHKMFRAIALLSALLSPAIACGQTQAQTHCLEEERHPGAETVMHLWTGPMQHGYYYQVGKAIEAASKHMHDGIRIHTCSSNGSETNVQALLKNEADFAIVQSDVAHQHWHCEGLEAQKCESQKERWRIRLVTPLFVEKAQVLVRPHLYLSSLSELRSSHCIWIGGSGSGSAPTARMLLEAAGWSRDQLKSIDSGCGGKVPKDLEDALKSLRNGDGLDAIIETRVAPFRLIHDALKDSEIQLLGIDWPTVQRMTQDGIYRETSIQRSEYPSADEGVYSIGVEALLLTRNNADADAVRAMAELLKEEQSDIENHLRRNLLAEGGARGDVESDTGTMVDGAMIGPATLTLVGSKVSDSTLGFADPEARSFLWTWPIRRGTLIWLAILLAAMVAIAVCLKTRMHRHKLVSGKLREILFAFCAVLLWAAFALWLQAVEGDLNEHFTTLWASAFSLLESVLAKLPVQFSFAPTPTTRMGSAVVSTFSYLAAMGVTVYMLPWLKKSWPWLRPAFWGSDKQSSKKNNPKSAAEPTEASQESTSEKQDVVLAQARGAGSTGD